MLATMRLEASNPFTPLGVLGKDDLSDEEEKFDRKKSLLRKEKKIRRDTPAERY